MNTEANVSIFQSAKDNLHLKAPTCVSLQLLPFSRSAEHTETQVFKHFPENSDHIRGVCMTQELL